VLVWRHGDDQYRVDPVDAEITLTVDRVPFEGARVRVRHWRIDARHSNSHAAWTAVGKPQDPSDAQLAAIKDRQGLERFEPDREVAVRDGAVTVRVGLPLPGASLLELDAVPESLRRAGPGDRMLSS
jgi:xylan 1,4-beta-xylosidase